MPNRIFADNVKVTGSITEAHINGDEYRKGW